ncbi:dynein heavy chain, partial [Coemansia thaxteri]
MDDLEPSPGEVERVAAVYCDPNIVKRYLLNLVPVLLGSGMDDDDDGEFEAVKVMFSFPDSSAKCKAFANDPAVPVLYVIKETEADSSYASFVLASELAWTPTHAGSIALIKRAPTLDPAVPLSRQIQVMNLPGPGSSTIVPESAATPKDREALPASIDSVNPYEALHAYVRFAVSPYFNAYVRAKELTEQQAQVQQAAAGDDGKDTATTATMQQQQQQQGIPMARKKLAELELSLLHLQQNMDIPDT